MGRGAEKSKSGEKGQQGRFFRKDEHWYFGTEEAAFGPFDRVYDIVMDECFLGRRSGEHREVTGGEIAQLLWPRLPA